MIDNKISIVGCGAITAVGDTLIDSYHNINLAREGISAIRHWDLEHSTAKYAGEVKHSDTELLKLIAPVKSHAKIPLDRSEILLFKAFEEALSNMNVSADYFAGKKVGLFYGTSLSGFVNFEKGYIRNYTKHDFVSPKSFISFPISFALDRLAYEYGLSGPRLCFSTACSSSLHAIIWGSEYLKSALVDVAICLGADPLSLISITGFNSLESLAQVRCTPFSEGDLGLSLGEGAGAVILERTETVNARNGKSRAWVAGYACNSDAYHITASDPTGRGISNCINDALKGIKPALHTENIFVAAHGTGTPHNDKVETRAILNSFGSAQNLLLSSAKSCIGHTLGASGIIELALLLQSLEAQKAYPTTNFTKARSGCDLNYVQNQPQDFNFNLGVKNAFAFGGNNVSVSVTNHVNNVILHKSELQKPTVAVTGIYQISSAGSGLDSLRAALVNGNDFFTPVDLPNKQLYKKGLSTKAAKISDDLLKDLVKKFRIKNSRRMDRFTQMACVAAMGCIKEAGVKITPSNASRIAIIANTGTGHISSVQNFYDGVLNKGLNNGDPSLFPNTVLNAHIGHLTIETGIKGYTTVIANGDVGAVNSLVLAQSLLESNAADYVLLGASTEYNGAYHKAMAALGLSYDFLKPYTPEAKGYVLGEGAVFLMLERETDAGKRSAQIHCVLDSVYADGLPVFPGTFRDPFNSLAKIYERYYSAKDFAPHAVFGVGKSIKQHDNFEIKALDILPKDTPLLSASPVLGYIPGVAPLINLAAWLSIGDTTNIWQNSPALCQNKITEQKLHKVLFNALTEGGNAGTFAMRLPND